MQFKDGHLIKDTSALISGNRGYHSCSSAACQDHQKILRKRDLHHQSFMPFLVIPSFYFHPSFFSIYLFLLSFSRLSVFSIFHLFLLLAYFIYFSISVCCHFSPPLKESHQHFLLISLYFASRLRQEGLLSRAFLSLFSRLLSNVSFISEDCTVPDAPQLSCWLSPNIEVLLSVLPLKSPKDGEVGELFKSKSKLLSSTSKQSL